MLLGLPLVDVAAEGACEPVQLVVQLIRRLNANPVDGRHAVCKVSKVSVVSAVQAQFFKVVNQVPGKVRPLCKGLETPQEAANDRHGAML